MSELAEFPSPAPATEAVRFTSLAAALDQSFGRHGSAPALVIGAATYSYGALWNLAGLVADRLDALSLSDNARVAMSAPSSVEAYAVMLGILRSGRAYLPVNPSWSPQIVRRLAREGGACCVLSDSDLKALIEGRMVTPTLFDHVDHGACRAQAEERAAAIVFTSASTGSSKGVILPERSVLFHARTYGSMLGLTEDDCVTLFPSLFVGASISNVFGAWLAGASLCRLSLVDDGLTGMLDRIQRQRVSVLHLVPTVFRRLSEPEGARRAFQNVRCVKLGGERVTGLDVQEFNRTIDGSGRLLNGLGITEAGGNVTFGEVSRELPLAALAPVGTLVNGIDADVIPEDGHEARGELVVRSAFLASGYVGDSGASRFQVHDDGTRSFRTGDLVHRAEDGSWLHLGRTDEVVQVNGMRVSLPDVEAALQQTPGIEEACVFLDAHRSGRDRLLAAVATGPSVRVSALRTDLAERLEAREVPDLFYRMESFPLSPGGKVDRVRVRGQIRSAVPMRDAAPASPSDPLETQLLAAWRHVLRVPDVGVNDSIFECGADSLVAVELLTLLDQIGVSVSTAELYEHPTVTTIAAHLRARDPRGPIRSSAVVLLKQGSRDLNLVVVPGAGSSVLALFALAHSLPDDLTVYGLQYPGIDDDGQYRTSVADLATYFLEQIRARIPGESYGLAGTSFGGTVAFDMARRLEQSGARVPFLGLIDTYAPGYLTLRRQLSFRSRARALVRWVLPIGVKHVWTARNVVSGLRQKWVLLRAGVWLRGSRTRPRPHERRFQYLMTACLMASRRYQLDPIQSTVHFFSVDEQVPEDLYGRDETLGWSQASTGGVEVIRVPGRHGTHIRPPHVRTLGERLGCAAIASLRPSSSLGRDRDS